MNNLLSNPFSFMILWWSFGFMLGLILDLVLSLTGVLKQSNKGDRLLLYVLSIFFGGLTAVFFIFFVAVKVGMYSVDILTKKRR